MPLVIPLRLAAIIISSAALAGCVGSTSQTQGAVPQGESVDQRARTGSVVFASGGLPDQVDGYSLKNGKVVDALTMLCSGSMTTDTQDNLYVVKSCEPMAIFVYRPGSKDPSLRLKLAPFSNGYGAPDVAVSRSGEVATSNGGVVTFFKKGARRPFNVVGNAKFCQVTGLAYDDAGNIYLSSSKGLGEIVGGGKGSAITLFNITPQPPQGHIAIDAGAKLLLDLGTSGSGVGTIYQYPLPNPTAQSGAVSLTGVTFPEGISLSRDATSVFVSGLASGGSPYVWQFPYPAGGSPTRTIAQTSEHFIGVANLEGVR